MNPLDIKYMGLVDGPGCPFAEFEVSDSGKVLGRVHLPVFHLIKDIVGHLWDDNNRTKFINEKTERRLELENIGRLEEVSYRKGDGRLIYCLKLSSRNQYFCTDNETLATGARGFIGRVISIRSTKNPTSETDDIISWGLV